MFDRLRVLSVLEMPNGGKLQAENGCPNLTYPSDHMRIETKFEVIENSKV